MGAGNARQVQEEQQAVDAIYARLDADLSEGVAAHARAMAAPLDAAAELSARDAEVARLAGNVRRLRQAERSLCFGRIDDGRGRSLHVGRIGLRAEAGELLLVDWRAAAARPFYSATMAAPMGLRRRRHLRLEGRRVVGVSDEILDGTEPTAEDMVGDGPLVDALSRARTGRMREAAATLQSEQHQIVRSAHRGIMVVDGGPGTGKTIVALHRAAYVLYAFAAIADRGVLIFGPNRRFLSYISDVLPSLGENDVRLATLADLIGAEATRIEADDLARIKGRARLGDALGCWVRAHEPYGTALELRTAHGAVVLGSDVVDAARRSALQGGIGHNGARGVFLERVVDELVNELEQQTAREQSDFEADLRELQGIDLDRMFGGSFDEREHAADGLDIDWDRIRDELLDDPGIDQIIGDVWPLLRAEDAVTGLLGNHDALADALPNVSAHDISRMTGSDQSGWSEADLGLLDEARALIDGLPEIVYGHIVVDEAQQLTEMQWRMLMRRCPQRSMTIVGDLAQAGPATTIRSWDDALGSFVGNAFVHHTLTVNYRTTAEILEATRPLLARIAPQQQLSHSIRHGESPRLLAVAEEDIAPALSELILRIREAHPGELIGVVATTDRPATLDAKISRSDTTFLAARDARGLEFDIVVIVDPDGIQTATEAGLRDLYVAQTRATKRLIMLKITPTQAETC